MAVQARAEEILRFWFGDLVDPSEYPHQKAALWFSKNEKIDNEIREQFGDDVAKAGRGEYDAWARDPRGRLAAILLLDQFTRNIFRGKPEAFEHDARALEFALGGVALSQDKDLFPIERVFLYLPLEHSESVAIQRLSVTKYEELLEIVSPTQKAVYEDFLDYAQRHADIIDRFGRFPHRNAILSRESTPEEEAFLKEPGSSF